MVNFKAKESTSQSIPADSQLDEDFQSAVNNENSADQNDKLFDEMQVDKGALNNANPLDFDYDP